MTFGVHERTKMDIVIVRYWISLISSVEKYKKAKKSIFFKDETFIKKYHNCCILALVNIFYCLRNKINFMKFFFKKIAETDNPICLKYNATTI